VPGDLGFPVFATPLGRIGMLICYDGWFPEAWRLPALQGGDIVCVPTNSVPILGQDPDREAMANILCMAAAHSNSPFVAAADHIGRERQRGGDRLRRMQSLRRAAQAALERLQPGAARPAQGPLRRDAGRRRAAGLVLSRDRGAQTKLRG
jgi:predicted amidohydrolase